MGARDHTHLCPNISVDLVSASLKTEGEQQITMVVLQFPPRESWRIRVILLSRYGTCVFYLRKEKVLATTAIVHSKRKHKQVSDGDTGLRNMCKTRICCRVFGFGQSLECPVWHLGRRKLASPFIHFNALDLPASSMSTARIASVPF